MLWVWFAVGLALCVFGFLGAALIYDDINATFFLPGMVGLAGLIVAVVFGAMLASQHYDRVSCGTFAKNTGRQTKFVHYTAYSWDCLTPTKGGKWIPTKNLREFGAQP